MTRWQAAPGAVRPARRATSPSSSRALARSCGVASADTAGGTRAGPTVLSCYRAPGPGLRAQVLSRGWADWQQEVVAELSAPHPDLAGKLARVEVARYGHGMVIPVPGTLAQVASGQPRTARLSFAHSDWAGYSIFEEAFTAGHRAGAAADR